MKRPCQHLVFTDHLRHNLTVFQNLPQSGSIWAVAKARGYGIGLKAALAGFSEAQGLAVLELSEAQEARDLGWTKPILLLEGLFDGGEIPEALALGCELVVHQRRQLDWLTQAALSGQHAPRLWIKLNTGMNRLGLDETALSVVRPQIQSLRSQGQALGWMTHFSSAEQPGAADLPLARFGQLCAQAGALPSDAWSVANTAAAVLMPQTRSGWIRPGVGLYGASPLAGVPADAPVWSVYQALGLKCAAALRAQIIAEHWVDRGAAVGYGGRFVARRRTRIGVASVGYADGYLRTMPDGTPVWVEGVLCPLAGRVSMDMITIDLTDNLGAQVGSPVEVWGPMLSPDLVADHAGSSAYELMTGVAARVDRQILDRDPWQIDPAPAAQATD